MVVIVRGGEMIGRICAVKMRIFQIEAHHWPINMGKHLSVAKHCIDSNISVNMTPFLKSTCANSCLKYLVVHPRKWVIARVISEHCPYLVITYLLTGMKRQQLGLGIGSQQASRGHGSSTPKIIPPLFWISCLDDNDPIIDMGIMKI